MSIELPAPYPLVTDLLPRRPERLSRYIIVLDRSHDEYDNETMTEAAAIRQVRDEIQQAMDDLGVPSGLFRIAARNVGAHDDLFGRVFVPAIVLGPAEPEP